MMNNTLTPVEMLDKVLEWFAMDVSQIKLSVLIPRTAAPKDQALRNMAEVFLELNTPEFLLFADLIFDKLVRDKYIKVLNQQTPIAPIYAITFDGILFSRQGGYQKEDKRKVIQATLQSWQTWAIVIGTFLAGLYGLWEIARNIYHLSK
jgi:hypothetical protein